jgi:hypothetical protein
MDPGRDPGDELVEQHLDRVAHRLARRRYLRARELPLEPLDHPVAAVDLDLQRPGAGHGGRERRDERDRLHVAPTSSC